MHRQTLLLLIAVAPLRANEDDIQKQLESGARVVKLPAGVVEISAELLIPAAARDLDVLGDPVGTVLRATPTFEGRATLRCQSGHRIRFSGFEVDGNRAPSQEPHQPIHSKLAKEQSHDHRISR